MKVAYEQNRQEFWNYSSQPVLKKLSFIRISIMPPLIDEAYVMSLTVVSLKRLCSKYKLTSKGIKGNLRNRLFEHLHLGKYAQEGKSTKVSTKQGKLKVQKKKVEQRSSAAKRKTKTTLNVEKGYATKKRALKVETNKVVSGSHKEPATTTISTNWKKVIPKRRNVLYKKQESMKSKLKNAWVKSRVTLSKSKAVKRQLSTQKNYRPRQVQNKGWRNEQLDQKWNMSGGRVSQQVYQSWLLPGLIGGRSNSLQHQKRSLFIGSCGLGERRSGGDRSSERLNRSCWQSRNRGSNIRNERGVRR